ncbi:(d)CMP kinase [Halalkalibacter alkaliphilus]|uniref:Cytidylate kinase n=1 Tax=Halalkalibacter alkaliphilus TaxID=2917993 RepID=A0A9X2CTN7_9BACI|nr:(d)CMP kinase [Halalkalibacter alkaliphilus]MCL7748048.1 (d)CMP kinase [Halalkalibacter alkaliphilus]
MINKINVAIDGPAGAGKSTVAKMVADQLSLLYIDTGAMYRTLAYAALENNVNVNDGDALKHLLDQLTIKLVNENSGTKVLLNDRDVSNEIRTAEVNKHVPVVASHEAVRLEMVERQRMLASEGNAILDGRDIGTHVLPDAEVKIFLNASVDVRAQRRHEEQVKKGLPSNLDELKKEIAKRDKLDSTREVAPLCKAVGATEVDTTSFTIPEVVDTIINLVKKPVS